MLLVVSFWKIRKGDDDQLVEPIPKLFVQPFPIITRYGTAPNPVSVMSRQQSRYALPKDTDFRAALEASDDGYSDDDRSSSNGSSRSSGSTRSSAYTSSTTASARSPDRYADRASSAKKGQGGSARNQQMRREAASWQ